METPKTKECPKCPGEMIRHNAEYNCLCGYGEMIPETPKECELCDGNGKWNNEFHGPQHVCNACGAGKTSPANAKVEGPAGTGAPLTPTKL